MAGRWMEGRRKYAQEVDHPMIQIDEMLDAESWHERSTFPAELRPTIAYDIHNTFGDGVPLTAATEAAWRIERARCYVLPGCFVLLGVAPPSRPDEQPLLLYAIDRGDGEGTQLLGAWRLDPRIPTDLPRAFSHIVVRYGRKIRFGKQRSLFWQRAPAGFEPVVEGIRRDADIDLQTIDLRDELDVQRGSAWTFAIDLSWYRADQRDPRSPRG